MRMKKYLLFSAVAVVLLFGLSFSYAQEANGQAAPPDGITFPIPELGNCGDKEACKAFCDDTANFTPCRAFAEAHGIEIRPPEEEGQPHAAVVAGGGPGGCTNESECRTYCETPEHFSECINYAESAGAISPAEADRARNTLERGVEGVQSGPGGCNSQESCEAYCDAQEHREECISFGVANGYMTPEEAEFARKNARAISEGGPGGCRSESECRSYCGIPAHAEECLQFAIKEGHIDAQTAQFALQQVRQGRLKPPINKEEPGPGGCTNSLECRTYCDDVAHADECISFAETKGFMTSAQAAEARKFTKLADKIGPGGCRGRECRDYCEAPGREAECLDFAIREGIIPPEQAEKAKKFLAVAQDGGPGGCRGRNCEAYCGDPSHRDECFSFAEKNGLIGETERRQIEIGQKLESKMKESGGPGGCKTEGECMGYCNDPSRVEECVAFASVHGGVSVEEAEQMLKSFTAEAHGIGPQDRFGGSRFGPPGVGPGGFGPQGFGPEGFGPEGFGPPREVLEQLKSLEDGRLQRFREIRQLESQFRGGEGEGGGGFPSGFGPPEGFGPPSGIGSGEGREGTGFRGFSGPGGCQSPAECIRYCTDPAHRAECGFGGSAPRSEFGPSMSPSGIEGESRSQTVESETAQTAQAGSASISIRRDRSSGLYEFTIRASNGIRQFAINPEDGSPYSGGLSCDKTFERNNVRFTFDLVKARAVITDCNDKEFTFGFLNPTPDAYQGVSPEQLPQATPPAQQAPAETSGRTMPQEQGAQTTPTIPLPARIPEGFIPEGVPEEFLRDGEIPEEFRKFIPEGVPEEFLQGGIPTIPTAPAIPGGFVPPEGFVVPGGFTQPPAGTSGAAKSSSLFGSMIAPFKMLITR